MALGCMRPDFSEWKLMFFVLMKVSLRFEFMLFEDCCPFNDCIFVPDFKAFGVLLVLMSVSSATPN